MCAPILLIASVVVGALIPCRYPITVHIAVFALLLCAPHPLQRSAPDGIFAHNFQAVSSNLQYDITGSNFLRATTSFSVLYVASSVQWVPMAFDTDGGMQPLTFPASFELNISFS